MVKMTRIVEIVKMIKMKLIKILSQDFHHHPHHQYRVSASVIEIITINNGGMGMMVETIVESKKSKNSLSILQASIITTAIVITAVVNNNQNKGESKLSVSTHYNCIYGQTDQKWSKLSKLSNQ